MRNIGIPRYLSSGYRALILLPVRPQALIDVDPDGIDHYLPMKPFPVGKILVSFTLSLLSLEPICREP